MNIAITSLYLPSGSKIGVGYQVHYLANEFVSRGHQVTVFSQSGPSEGSRYETVAVDSGRHLRTFGFAWNLRHIDFTPFDVLNAHGDDWFLWGRRRPRHIHTYHGSCFAEMVNSRKWVDRLRMGMLAMCEYESCFLADELVAVSENTIRYIPMIRRVIPNGVNTDAFHPSPEKSDAPALLFVGTMHGRKRGKMLLDLFQNVIRPQVPGAQFWGVCEEKIEGPGVTWFGRVPMEQLADLYRRAWAFCLPSSYEGFGVPYIEAMASGVAVVASPNVGAIEVTRSGRDGLIATDDQLAQAIVNVLSDSSLRTRLEQAGLERARDFSFSRICKQYEQLYSGSSPTVGQTVAS